MEAKNGEVGPGDISKRVSDGVCSRMLPQVVIDVVRFNINRGNCNLYHVSPISIMTLLRGQPARTERRRLSGSQQQSLFLLRSHPGSRA